MATVELVFCHDCGDSEQSDRTVLIVGQLPHLHCLAWSDVRDILQSRVDEETWEAALKSLKPNPTDRCPLWLKLATVAALPSKISRHNTPSSAHTLTRLVQTCLPGRRNGHIAVACERTSVFASACAIARAFPLFSRQTGDDTLDKGHRVTVQFFCVEPNMEPLSTATLTCLSRVAESIRLTARIVDSPCNEMDTEQFLKEVGEVGAKLGIAPIIIKGEELRKRGFGGIYGVGSAAASPPALAVLSHTPPTATQTIAWVGKGIVYNSGGLMIKGRTVMPGMKRDCAGAAAVLGAFSAAVRQGFKENLHAIFCLAENSVGPKATRPDDILRLYSGKTVEIRNTDAEGRLLLADGVVYACRDLKADIILDMATLTSAQGIATGRYHAGLLTNREEWERACVAAGRSSGDLVQPLVFSPELHFSEFSSAMADMKNFDRSNALCSCGGLFVGAQLGFEWTGVWIHVDMAFPAYSGERATGYGVALLLALFGGATEDALLQLVSPLGPEMDAHSDGHPPRCNPKRRKLI
ncbi:probable aminopeptidase NPEPL1 isoform X1 [Megalops cyprinoides]|uniref:probable aminopeptidase NPEPL1 isoform X1 n=1 Tax=Megalops cyprinoides TaxID=118141 RepID=UPI0018651423|nr:probable aminopeptidase NPEPL1 isoform X1 [Megalops cyprinoides]